LPGTKKNCFCANTEAEEDETRPLKAVEKKLKEDKAAPATFIRHRGYVAWDEPSNNVLDQKDSTFVVRPSKLGTGVHF
jgi:hypothetical protein